MEENINLKGQGALFVTDSFRNSVHGISVFSSFFVQDFLAKKHVPLYVLEVETKKVFNYHANTSLTKINYIYVNANFSNSDYLVRKKEFWSFCESLNIRLNKSVKIILISHGWPKIKFRLNYYGIYYRLRNMFRANDFKRLLFYNEIIFLSQACDEYRHADYAYCLRNGYNFSIYDFPNRFLKALRQCREGLLPASDAASYILIISNLDPIKNLWWVIGYHFSGFFSKKRRRTFIILTERRKSIEYHFFSFFAKLFNVLIVNDQTRKNELLVNCNYLFIPSYSESLSIVSLEARAFNKKVVSLYKIPAMAVFDHYHHL